MRSNAANKAFIVNRVGDFGMIVGLMVIWAGMGTFSFGEIFSQVRPGDGLHLHVPAGMTYGLLVLAGLGIFCGCVGKSAQFPLHVWLPDAMEGPTPVSALIHAATMVAAGVYLVGRFYPVFTPEVLLVIACVGCITLLLAASIALTATDIKRVLAYSTVSQLGFMMLALGLGGWLAGMFHLFTHAFFKSLLFLCSGSVIHSCGTNEMPMMGGLRKKMPVTAYTMLIGCLAIAGAGVPTVIGLSGFHSKDYIITQCLSFWDANPRLGGLFFYAALAGAGMTAFYMFRLWYLTFAGNPRDGYVHHHAHESPKVDDRAADDFGHPGGDRGLERAWDEFRPGAAVAAGPAGGNRPGHLRRPVLAGRADAGRSRPRLHEISFKAEWAAFGVAMAGFRAGHGLLRPAEAQSRGRPAVLSRPSIGCWCTSGGSTSCTPGSLSGRCCAFPGGSRRWIRRGSTGWPTIRPGRSRPSHAWTIGLIACSWTPWWT